MARDLIHPGKFLADELNALNMTATELGGILHVPPNRIYQIIRCVALMVILRLMTCLLLSMLYSKKKGYIFRFKRCIDLPNSNSIKQPLELVHFNAPVP